MDRYRVIENSSESIEFLFADSLRSSTKGEDEVSDKSYTSILLEKYKPLSSSENDNSAANTADGIINDSVNDVTMKDATILNQSVVSFKHDVYSILSSFYENEVFETGIVNPSEKYFIEEYSKDAIGTLNTLNFLFWNNFEASGRKVNSLIGVLHTISHMDYVQTYPIGISIAVGALNHKNQEVCEYAIKCFENWNHPDGITKLKSVRFASKWLENYANAVIEGIEC